MNKTSEYQFYQDQLEQAKGKSLNAISISVEFLDQAMKEIKRLQKVNEVSSKCWRSQQREIGMLAIKYRKAYERKERQLQEMKREFEMMKQSYESLLKAL